MRIAPLPIDHDPELAEAFRKQLAAGHYVANSMLILQRRPKIAKAMRALGAAVFDAEGSVTVAFKRLLAYAVARTHGCGY